MCCETNEEAREIPSTLYDIISHCVHLDLNEFSAWFCFTYVLSQPLKPLQIPASDLTPHPLTPSNLQANFIIRFKLKK